MKESRGITPLRTILRNCLNHIESLETNRSICDNYDKEFQDLKQFSETLKVHIEFSCTEGEKEVNRKKNRYKDILPFNISRVVLSEYAGIPGSDYINANFIKGASGSPAYIASQGPLPNTVNDFWRMVVECEVQVIVMACNAQESGKHKCENYWVEKEGEEKRFGMVQICLVKASTVCPDFLVRTMRLKYTNDKDVIEERTVCQFHYSAWPDHGVPPLVRPLLDMVRLVRDTQASETLPVLVHCSAGCGRTGTICAIDFVWGLLRAGKLTEEFSLFNLVKDMRKQRVAMVQTKEQYILVHQAVRELFKEQLRVIESHPYENIDFNGIPLIKDTEEPFYDTITVKKDENCDEKQDKSEVKEKGEDGEIKKNKSDTAPPLPKKKKAPNVLFSKQEKEAENLTEKNRSSFSEKDKEKTDALGGILGKPRIVKLRSLFEKSPTAKDRTALKDKGSQTVSRSHSLGAIRKPALAEAYDPQIGKIKPWNPPEQNVTEVAKLKNSKSFSKSVPIIKRSKSLKAFGQNHFLSVPSSNSFDQKHTKTPATKANDESENDSQVCTFRKKSNPPCDMWLPIDFVKESSKRRRSLESLMGDTPPAITWPTIMMGTVTDSSNSKSIQKVNSLKPNCHATQSTIPADLLRHQLQCLSVETEKKINNFVSSIGIRERRNSFRQAISKNTVQNTARNYCEPLLNLKKVVGGDYPVCPHTKNMVNSNEVSQYSDEPNETLEAKTTKKISKNIFDVKKYKIQESSPDFVENLSDTKKFNGKYVLQQISVTPSTHPNVVDHRTCKVISTQKNRTFEELEVNFGSKNLFLKKLNSEILSERERDNGNGLKHVESQLRSNCDDFEKPLVSRFVPVTGLVHSDSKQLTSTSVYGINSDSADELDGPKNGQRASRRTESGQKNFQSSWPNLNSQGHLVYAKTQKPLKVVESYKCYTTVPDSHSSSYNRVNAASKVLPYKNSADTSFNLRRDEQLLQDGRRKEAFFSVPPKRSICSVVSKVPSIHESDVSILTSYPRNSSAPNPDLRVIINSKSETNNNQLTLPPKVAAIEKSSKAFDCLPWSHSASSRSSGEASSSDQHSHKSDSSKVFGHYDSENIGQPDAKIIKKVDHSKRTSKIRINDYKKIMYNPEASGNNSIQPKRPEEPSSASMEFYGYDAASTSKIRQHYSKYSKDDFLIEEPIAPPRVRRHASVTIPRSNLNNSDHISSRISSDNNLGSDRNTTLQADKNAWSESFGVDLDAIAASMQQAKGESSVLKNGSWPSKNYLTSTGNSISKKKQHYL